ncbi:MAG TPA: DUF4089 domain-containing protein [Sphingobium sp.]
MTDEEVVLLARMAGLEIDPAHLPGVTRNLGILLDQAALLFDPPIDMLVEPAPVYRP